MSRFAMFCSGLFLACSMSGCCLMHGMGGYPGGYYGGGGCGGGCNTGACGAYAPGGYPSAGLYGAGAPATAFAAPPTTAYYPYAQTAFAPQLDPLPTH